MQPHTRSVREPDGGRRRWRRRLRETLKPVRTVL